MNLDGERNCRQQINKKKGGGGGVKLVKEWDGLKMTKNEDDIL